MSGTPISDGLTGRTAIVDVKNRLTTSSSVRSRQTDAAIDGNSYYINHDVVTLTSDNVSFVSYFKNNDTLPWKIDFLSLTTGLSVGGAGSFRTLFVSNPTGGSIIDSGGQSSVFNQNLGNPKELNGDFLFGFEGATADGESTPPALTISSGTVIPIVSGSPVIVEPGSSLALGVQPPSGNTSMEAQHIITLHRITD